MTPLYDSQEFHKKMLELQGRLRKSEDERMKLEERFNLLSQDSRSRRETCINNLRMRYIEFLEEQRLRDERNHQILGALDKIDGSLARMTARTDRLGILRKQYEAYLLRVYASRSAGGGTGDSGVGSHNEDRSPKTNISQIQKNPLPTERVVPHNAGNPPSFIPQSNYAQSYIGTSNISHFHTPMYTPGQETYQSHVVQAHGQGDSSTIPQSQRTPQLSYGSQSQNIPDTYLPIAELMPNISREFVSPNQSHPQQLYAKKFLRSNNQLTPNYPQAQHRQLHDISKHYLQSPTSPYADDSSMAELRNLPDPRAITSPESQPLPASQSNRANTKIVRADLTDVAFGPYRHSTPLPGYLDYSTRYSRDPSIQGTDTAPRYGFTRRDLEKVIDRNEQQMLPKDYLHNPETVKSVMHPSKLSSLQENIQRVSDTKLSGNLNDNELDQYINRIRSLHRDNDQNLEALDNEQNTSVDLINATLSDDGPEQLTLHSDDEVRPNRGKILPKDVESVFALADELATESGKLIRESEFDNDAPMHRNIPSKSDSNLHRLNENIVAKPTLAESNDPSSPVLKTDMTSDNLSVSITRDDILSGTASVSVNQIQDTNGKFRPKIAPLIADVDTSRLNITNVATVSENNLGDLTKLVPTKRGGNQLLSSSTQEYMETVEKRSNPAKEVMIEQRPQFEVPSSCIQSELKDHGSVLKETEIHEDIEGDKVSLIEEIPIPDQVIDIVKELQPPSLQHYEKNGVEIRKDDEGKKYANTQKAVSSVNAKDEIEERDGSVLPRNLGEADAVEVSPQDSMTSKIYAESDIADKKYAGAEQRGEQIFNSTKTEINNDLQHLNDVERKYEPIPDHKYSTYEHQFEQNLASDVDKNCDAGQRFGDNSELLHDPGSREQLPASSQLYVPNEVHDGNQHFEDNLIRKDSGDSNEHNAAAVNEQYRANPNEQYTADPNEEHTPDPNEHYAADSNEHYAFNPSEQYATNPNEHYEVDSTEHYIPNPNEQYAADSNDQYGTEPNEQYPPDSSKHYTTGPNQEYTSNPNEHYQYYENQPYQNDPNAPYENADNDQYNYVDDHGYQHDPNQQYEDDPNQQYNYDPNQQYEHDPNQQYEHGPNQQYEHDPNQQYEHDPNQQYGHDPNQQYEHGSNQQYENYFDEFSAEGPNHGYKEEAYGQNQSGESVGYEEPDQAGNQQFEKDSQQNYTSCNLELRSSNEDDATAAGVEQSEIQVATGDSYAQEVTDSDRIRTKEYSTEGKKKDKDVIRALLESDTESTIERNPSNNTESDFDFN